MAISSHTSELNMGVADDMLMFCSGQDIPLASL